MKATRFVPLSPHYENNFISGEEQHMSGETPSNVIWFRIIVSIVSTPSYVCHSGWEAYRYGPSQDYLKTYDQMQALNDALFPYEQTQ